MNYIKYLRGNVYGFLDDLAESIEEQSDLSEFKQAMKSELQTKVEEAKTKLNLLMKIFGIGKLQ